MSNELINKCINKYLKTIKLLENPPDDFYKEYNKTLINQYAHKIGKFIIYLKGKDNYDL